MPSFYTSRHHLPLTPPEYSTGFQNNTCSGMQYQQHGYGAQQLGRRDEMAYDYTGRYTQTHPYAPLAIHQQPTYPSTVNMPVPRLNEPVGLPLPPVRSLDQSMVDYQRPQEYRHYEQQPQQKPKDEKPVGGVSAKLDYDMEWMTDFVAEMAQSLVQPSRTSHTGFRAWVNSVLCATRLPSATIVLSLHYLESRMRDLNATGRPGQSESYIYRLLTVSLIMGSKFLDDNTFINRSWADVSGIDIKDLNNMEMDWLSAIDWKLHVDPAAAQGFNFWMQHWKDFESARLSRGAQSLKLSPLDTNVHRHAPAHKSFSPQSTISTYTPLSTVDYSARQYHSNHHTPVYAPFDPWLIRRSATDSSPTSAPHTGPTTPEYYGGPGTWAPLDNGAYSYSRRTYGGYSQPQPAVVPQPQVAPYTPFTPTYQQNNWTGHSAHCNCGHCARQHVPYFVGPHYGYQTVAA